MTGRFRGGYTSNMRRKDREVTDITTIEEILLQCKTCHVAMVDDGLPYVVPMSYGYRFVSDKVLELYLHSASEGRKLDILKRNNKVCFELSCEGEPIHSKTPCSSGYYFSSIIGFGEVVFIEDTNEKCEVLSILFRHQTNREVEFTGEQAENLCLFKIVSESFAGKKKPRPNTA